MKNQSQERLSADIERLRGLVTWEYSKMDGCDDEASKVSDKILKLNEKLDTLIVEYCKMNRKAEGP